MTGIFVPYHSKIFGGEGRGKILSNDKILTIKTQNL
jgi:hypothetical protein